MGFLFVKDGTGWFIQFPHPTLAPGPLAMVHLLDQICQPAAVDGKREEKGKVSKRPTFAGWNSLLSFKLILQNG